MISIVEHLAVIALLVTILSNFSDVSIAVNIIRKIMNYCSSNNGQHFKHVYVMGFFLSVHVCTTFFDS